jgi:uncharacterized protein YlxP (DUF503 family)
MYIGVGRFELYIPAARSLKDKRQVVRSVTQVIRHRFPVAVAEVEHQDLWQRSTIGISCVSGTMSHAHELMDEVERTIEKVAAGGAEVSGRSVTFLSEEDL